MTEFQKAISNHTFLFQYYIYDCHLTFSVIFYSFSVGLCDNSDNMIITIRRLISCYRYWLHYLSIISSNYIAQYISALGDA